MFKSLYGLLLSQSPKAKTFVPAGHKRSRNMGSKSTSSSLSLGGPRLGGREPSSHPYQSSLSHMCILPALTSRLRVPQTLDDGQLELIQSQCINGQDYMLEEVSGNGLTEG
ncbi:hypothetical protein PCASD_09924 [Puccinia coronata f. sp. avenae]|uniref:Uncharacterized protein n=1 Tax=Puccinia coronata f. sp. avenae TaxID=200324 RepID=A0A2N5UJU7_9BASI|nr:hypothetical protein PCASD_09924 [Puccinia coronata f. sp. avenae]